MMDANEEKQEDTENILKIYENYYKGPYRKAETEQEIKNEERIGKELELVIAEGNSKDH